MRETDPTRIHVENLVQIGLLKIPDIVFDNAKIPFVVKKKI